MQVELADKYLECHERLCHAVGAKEWDKANDDIKNFLISPEDLIKSLVDVIRGQDDKLKEVNDIVTSLHVTARIDKEEYLGAMTEIMDVMDRFTPTVKEQDPTKKEGE